MIFKQDKLKHLLTGIGIGLVFGVQFSPLIGLLISYGIGLLKRGTPEFLDFLATALGGAIAHMVVKFVLGG